MKRLTILFAFGLLQTALLQPYAVQSGSAIEGVVLELETDRPLDHVEVSLLTASAPYQPGPMVMLPVYAEGITNSEGRFKIDVKPGRYRIVPALDGFVFSHAPQLRAPREPGIWVEVSQSPGPRDIEVRMIRAGVISGRAVNDAGRPPAGSIASLARYCYNDYGQRVLCPIPGTSSPGAGVVSTTLDDRGQFRFFGLQAGEYYLRFFNSREPIGSPRTTYFPGTLDEGEAKPIHVGAAEEVNLGVIPVRTTPTKSVRVLFHYTDSGSVLGNREVRLAGTTLLAENRPGEIIVKQLAPGQYDVVVTAGMRQSNPTAAAFYSMVRLNVFDADIDQEITFRRAARVSASFNVRDTAGLRSDVSGLNCYLHSIDTTSTCRSWLVPGFYEMELQDIPPDAYVVSAKLGGLDILPGGVQLDSDATLQVEMATPGAVVAGVVKDSKDEIVPGAVVALVPDAPLRAAGPLYRSMTSDMHGNYELRGIAPGAYHLFAWLELEGTAYRNPVFMKPFEDRGNPIHIEKAGQSSMDIRIVDEPAGNPK